MTIQEALDYYNYYSNKYYERLKVAAMKKKEEENNHYKEYNELVEILKALNFNCVCLSDGVVINDTIAVKYNNSIRPRWKISMIHDLTQAEYKFHTDDIGDVVKLAIRNFIEIKNQAPKNTSKAKEFINQLKEDKDLLQVWKDNIAMSFKDEVYNYEADKKHTHLSKNAIHIIANKAAERFLDSLLYIRKEPEPNKAYITTGKANQFTTT